MYIHICDVNLKHIIKIATVKECMYIRANVIHMYIPYKYVQMYKMYKHACDRTQPRQLEKHRRLESSVREILLFFF